MTQNCICDGSSCDIISLKDFRWGTQFSSSYYYIKRTDLNDWKKNPAFAADLPTTLVPLCPCSERIFLLPESIFNIDF